MDVLTDTRSINSEDISKPCKVCPFPTQYNYSTLLTTVLGKTAPGKIDIRDIFIHISLHSNIGSFQTQRKGFFF
jgi:hypothetical protein